MAQVSKDTTTVIQNQTNASQIFSIVQQIASHIKKDQMQEIIDRAKGLNIEDIQTVADLLSMALEKSHHLLKNSDRVLLLLSKLASSANIVAKNRIIRLERVDYDSDQSPNVYRSLGESSVEVRVVRQGKKDAAGVFDDDERLLTWVHLSHTNILPMYAAFLEGEDGPISVVSPHMESMDIVDHTKTLPQEARMPLICDVIDGLCYLHSLSIVHGSLNPQNVLISPDGRASITGLDSLTELFSIRYSAPEMLDQDEAADPKPASDIWSLGCIIYEVLCGRTPFYQIRQEGRVGAAVNAGKKPLRPSQDRTGVEEIGEAIWGPVSNCWEYEAQDRPGCLQIQKIFSSIFIHDDHSVPKSEIPPSAFKYNKYPTLNVDHARSSLARLVVSNLSMPLPSQIPNHLQKPLSGLADNLAKAETVAIAVKKLGPDDTQCLADMLDLIIEENLSTLSYRNPVVALLRKIMMSTHIFPQQYKINRIRYDPTPVTEAKFGKVYKGRDLNVCVSVVTDPHGISKIVEYLALWAHSSHPNVMPFYGTVHSGVNETRQVCLVSPYMKNGLLRDYASRLPQKFRLPLISDVIDALLYMAGLNITYDNVRGDRFLISDEGHVFIATFGAGEILASPARVVPIGTSRAYELRFYAPERAKNNQTSTQACVWSFGCLMYEVLSRKPPYHQYEEENEIRSALSRREPLRRPSPAEDDIDEIDDQFWDLIMGCCAFEPVDRPTLLEIGELLRNMKIQDNRLEESGLPGAEAPALRSHPDINWDHVKQLLDQIQVELLRNPLSKLIQNQTKDVALAAAQLKREDIRTLVDFLDLALKNHITLSDQRNRVLALLSRITTSTHIFPRRYELEEIKYHTSPMAGGGFGTVHRGVSDPKICVKVMTKVDANALMNFVKELILWAHASHQNVLPFYGVFVDETERICLVSPFMNKGNLRDYGPRLPQKKRIPLLYDVIQGLIYLHGLGVVHTDLKGENVLISDDGRGLITDFGASHVITATAKGGATTAPVVYTLRFTAPEIVLNRDLRPTQECDIWSFGCLCYELLSRKVPYFEYRLEAQVYAALVRGQSPKRPRPVDDNNENWDDFDEPDWDEIDDPSWSLIARCCVPRPEDRPSASRIQELVVDLKMWDGRPEAKEIPGAHLISLRSNPDVDLNRAGELLNELQVRFLVKNTLRYPTGDVITAVEKLYLSGDNAKALVEFWDLVLQRHLFTSTENIQALALLSALIASQRKVPLCFKLPATIQYSRVSLASGSFGTVHRGSDPNLCIKLTNFNKNSWNIDAQFLKALAPSAFSSHPNILPLYGTFFRAILGFLVSPFIRNGNFHDYALRFPHKSQILLISDVIEALLYLHDLGVVHGNLKGENILISDEGRALVTDFRPYHINIAAVEGGPTGSYVTSTLRFTAPELVRNSQMLPTTKSDVWSVGCLFYLMLSRKVPFYQYSQDIEIRSALSRGELPAWPVSTSDGSSKIDVLSRDLVTKCCALDPDDRPTLLETQRLLANAGIEDNRPLAQPCPGADILKLQFKHPGIDVEYMGDLLARIQSQLPPIPKDGEKEGEIQD